MPPDQHPSRAAPKCAECRHASSTPPRVVLYCDHPVAPVDPVTGMPSRRCTDMRGGDFVQTRAAAVDAICSRSGWLFEAAAQRCAACGGLGFIREPYSPRRIACPDCTGPRVGTRIPAIFVPVDWRGTLPPDPATGDQGISFTRPDGEPMYLRLSAKSAHDVRETLDPGYWAALTVDQSLGSPLSSSEPKSVPSDGASVWPPAASSTASPTVS